MVTEYLPELGYVVGNWAALGRRHIDAVLDHVRGHATQAGEGGSAGAMGVDRGGSGPRRATILLGGKHFGWSTPWIELLTALRPPDTADIRAAAASTWTGCRINSDTA
ncbi:hypothetical protein [Nocardia sp. NPDC004604]|uniref:hypothetical protein n=1 Tax=Nocardia sp. NPDC004604 TaxID=3157013 RepID=UPI0033A4AEDE